MGFITPGRIVLSGMASVPVCVVTIAENASQTVEVDVMSCTVKYISLDIAQGATKSFIMQDDSADYSAATEITFDIWQGRGGDLLLSKTLSGTDIVLSNPGGFTFDITAAESVLLSRGTKHCEAWVTLDGGAARCVGKGPFEVIYTRKYD